MSANKRKRISAEDAVQNILKFIEEESGDEDSELEDLYGDDIDMEVDSQADEVEETIETDEEAEREEIRANHNPFARRQHRRKQLTYSRLVNNIDATLCEDKYESYEIPSEKKIITGLLPTESKKKEDRVEIKFTNQPSKTTGRQNSQNIIKNKPGLYGDANDVENELQAFQLFFTETVIDSIIANTNQRIQMSIERIPAEALTSGKLPHIKPIDKIDLLSTIGLMYFRGLYGLNQHDIRLLFSPNRGMPIFGATMSRLRFQFITRHLSFDDINTREERWKKDRFTAMREIFEQCNKNFGKALVPEDYISLDETLYPARTQVSFKQYNPDKPAKYGVLFKSLNCARYPYTYQSHVYCGKPEVSEDNQYYVQGTANYIKYLVEKLAKCHNLSGRNITMDRLYTSFEIADWLSKRNITMVGTFQKNRVGIPPEIKEVKDKEELSSEIYWEENGKYNLSSYVVKNKKGKKCVLMLATVEPLLGVTKDDRKKKPALYKFYDFTKGGTDIVDQKMGSYTVKPKNRRWVMVAFSYLLDTIRVNSSTVFALTKKTDPKKVNSFEYGYTLAEQLVMPQIQRRSRNGLQSSVLAKIDLVMPKGPEQPPKDDQPDQSGRCKICIGSIKGDGFTQKRNSIGRTKCKCCKCKHFTCKKHCKNICEQCA